MTTLSLAYRWRHLRGSDRYAECVRVLFALGGVVAYSIITHAMAPVIPAMLGIIACALAETEDHWRSRLGTLLLTLACFSVSAFAVRSLMPYPWLFAAGLPLSTFVLVMLGAISGRYATIGGATLLLAIYTMIGADPVVANPWHEPLALMAGAAWYGLLSLLGSVIAPQRAVRHSLARVFDTLGDYLEGKAALFVPVHGANREGMQLSLAMQNERVVQALNDTRLTLVDRIGTRRPRGATASRLKLYFMAQDVHERISSEHYPYDALAGTFFHTDVLFRCAHLLRLQAELCRRRAESLRLRTKLPPAMDAHAAMDDLVGALIVLHASPQPAAAHLLRSLDALVRNLAGILAQLDGVAQPLPTDERESALQNPAPTSLADAWSRIRIQLTARSFRFRHALRLAIALPVGYGVLLAVHPRHGYWILLTTMLICQPSYGATRRRLVDRVIGTFAGLILGWATLKLMPFGLGQMLLIVLSGVLFFATRLRQYSIATAAITLYVVLCFNQVGSGYDVMLPRMLDTLIGACIAAAAIHLILPDWQGRRLHDVLADTVRSDARYLQKIMQQYTSGRRDDLDYRIARRDAHNANATLSGVLANILREPGQHRRGSEVLLRFLAASQTLLGHLSALAVHRAAITPGSSLDTTQHAGTMVAEALDSLAAALATGTSTPPACDDTVLAHALGASDTNDETSRLVLAQLALVTTQRDRLAALAAELHAG